MENSKLASLLRALSEKQLKRLRDFLRSPYFNKKPEIVQLYDQLLPFAPDFLGAGMAKETIYKQLTGSSVFDEKELGYLMSDLVKLIEEFLATELAQQHTNKRHEWLLGFYIEAKLEKFINSTMKIFQKYRTSYPYRDAEYYKNEFDFFAQENNFFEKQKRHENDDSLQKAIDNLDLYYLSLKLKYSCEMLNRRNVVMTGYKLRLLNEILLYLEQNPHHDIPPIAIYHCIFKCLREPLEEAHFIDLTNLLNRYGMLFHQTEARDVYTFALNYCIGKVNRGNEEYVRRLLDLYKQLIEREIIFENGFLSPWTYANIVSMGVRVADYHWTEQFIQQYKTRLNIEFRDNAYSYNLAYLYFHKGDYNRTIRLLNEVSFSDLFYTLNSKTLLVRSYYELNELDVLDSLIAAFSMYLKRNKEVPDSRIERFSHFVRFTKQLVNIFAGDKQGIQKLQELRAKIVAAPSTVNHKWLLEKVDAKIKKKH